jgi:diaminopropionate ammonia-lyase
MGLRDILVKDEGHRFGLKAFKSLGASWALDRIRRAGTPLTTVASATEGNHGRGVAWSAKQLGLKAVIFMTTKASPRRVEAIRREGAEVVLLEGTYEDAVRMCAERSAAEGWQVVADVGYPGYLETPGWISEGYSTILEEVKEQCADVPDVVIAQAGVGGFAAAVMEHFAAETPRPKLAIVEPTDADPLLESAMSADGRPTPSTGGQNTIMGGLNCSEVSLTAWPVIRDRADVYFSVTDDLAREAMRRYARPEGGDPRVVAGESGASGLAGLIALTRLESLAGAREALGLSPESTVLVFVTEGDTDPESWDRIVGG